MTSLSGIYGLRLLGAPGVRRAILVTVLVVVLGFRLLQVVAFSGQLQWGYDFSAYWSAAGRLLDGLPLYDPEQLAGTYSPQEQFRYLYPPFLAVVVTPLAAVFPTDYRLANLVWAILGAAIAAAVVVGVTRRESIGSRYDVLLLVGAAFAFPPLVGELVMGNVHLVLLGLLGGAWVALRDGRPAASAVAGWLIGIAALIKLFPALLILWLLLRGRVTAAAWAVVAIAILAAATLPVTGLGPWLQYPTVILNLGPPVDTRDTLAPIVWLSAIVPSDVARIVVAAAAVALVAWAARQADEPVGFAIAVTASVLVAPALYHHYLAILVLPLLLALRWAPPWGWVALAYLAMFGGEQAALGEASWVVNRLLPTLGALLLLGGLAVRAWRPAGSAPAPAPPAGAA